MLLHWPELTAHLFRRGDEWGLTGDLGRVDADASITLVDCANDMLICGGVSAVVQCAVFGIPDSKWGEVPVAFIRLAAGKSVTEAEIDEFYRAQTSRFKCPKRI